MGQTTNYWKWNFSSPAGHVYYSCSDYWTTLSISWSMVASIYPTDIFKWLLKSKLHFPCCHLVLFSSNLAFVFLSVSYPLHRQTSTVTHTFRRLMLLCRFSSGLAIVSPPVEHCQSTKEDLLSASVWCDLILYSPLKLYVHGALKERPTACRVIYMCVSRRYWVPLNLSQTSKILLTNKRTYFCMEVLLFGLF